MSARTRYDGGAKNLSDDFDTYQDRTFTVENGEVSFYGGPHDLDSGDALDPNRNDCHVKRGCTPDGQPPLIRLYPYADTTNPGGGMKFEDIYADGVNDVTDPGLAGWEIHIYGTGLLGEPIDETTYTDADGYWEFEKDYTYNRQTDLVASELMVCEVLQDGWTQSLPGGDGCYTWSDLAPNHAYGVQQSLGPGMTLLSPARIDFGLAAPGQAFQGTFINTGEGHSLFLPMIQR